MRNQCSVFTQDAGACYRLHIAIVPSTTLPSPALSWARLDMGARPDGRAALVLVPVRWDVYPDAHNQKSLHTALGHVSPACSSARTAALGSFSRAGMCPP